MKFTIASDPEIHLFDTKKKRVVSSIPVLKTDKYNPINLGGGVNAYADNILTEVSLPPSKNKKEFIESFRNAFLRLQKHVGSNYRIFPKAAHNYAKSELKDKAAWEIGCSPTFDCYAKKINNPGAFKDGVRTSSTHIHLGNEKLLDFETRHKAIKILDIIVGCSSVIFDKDNTAKLRRQKYGKAGEFRMPKHGIEWRILDSFVLNSPKLLDLTYDLVDYSMSFIENNKADEILSLIPEKDVINTINNCNKKMALDILKKIKLPENLFNRVLQDYSNLDFYKEWNIKI